MFADPVRMNPQSFLKLIVYGTVAALIAWTSLLLISLSIWSVSYSLAWRYALPTIQIQELYIATAAPFTFALALFWLLTLLVGAYSIWKSIHKPTMVSLEQKYASIFVILLTHAFLIINFFPFVSNTVLACALGTLLLVVFFLYSTRKEKIQKIR